MKCCLPFLALTLALGLTLPIHAADKVEPVRMGCGLMTFDTVPGWGLRPDGQSALGPTHGAVVIDKGDGQEHGERKAAGCIGHEHAQIAAQGEQAGMRDMQDAQQAVDQGQPERDRRTDPHVSASR